MRYQGTGGSGGGPGLLAAGQPIGWGSRVRVTLVRGRRGVRIVGPSSSSGGRETDGDSLLLGLVLDESEVVDGPGGSLISVVDSGAVLVIVAVVVVADVGVREAVVEKDGSTKLSGASAGSSGPVTYTTEATRTAMTAAPAALAPSTARVEWCQGCDGSFPLSSSSTSVTATDIRPGTCGNVGSAELGDHVGGEQLQVVQVGHVQKLQVDPLHAGLGVRPELVDDLARCADHG